MQRARAQRNFSLLKHTQHTAEDPHRLVGVFCFPAENPQSRVRGGERSGGYLLFLSSIRRSRRMAAYSNSSIFAAAPPPLAAGTPKI